MRKEENLDLIKKLASTKVDTSLLSSSRSLGVLKPLKRDDNDSRRKVSNKEIDEDSESEDSDISDEPAPRRLSHPVRQDLDKPVFGSGLKRPLDPEDGSQPMIKRRRRQKKLSNVFHTEASDEFFRGFSSDEASDLSQCHAPSLSSSADTQSDSDSDVSHGSDTSQLQEGSDDSSDDEEIDLEEREKRKERSSAFKAWATHQVNEALGFTATAESESREGDFESSLGVAKTGFVKPRAPEQDPLPPELKINSHNQERKAFSVEVARSPEIQETRLGLPIVAEEQKIMEAIYNRPVVVIWGATGSGKTTQVPQFLYEAGFGSPSSPNPGMIGITQPRRVAAVSMANRVSKELNSAKDKVAYQIRFDSSVSSKTAIKFMTDGILIREIATDFALLRYSVIIIDEAHERSANTDILIGMVSRIVDLRASMHKEDTQIKPLKLVIMSATLRVSDFLVNPNLFRSGSPPMVQVEGRQFPVTIHFARKTQRDYVDEAFHKVCKGHKKLPPGGMLVFLTGQNEINALSKRLKEAFSNTEGSQTAGHKVRITASEAPLETEDLELEAGNSQYDDVGEVDEEEDDIFVDDDQEFDLEDPTPASSRIRVLPLYSQLQTKDQLRVFEPLPDNTRLIVLATNVTETSITIPGIRYVFDTGRGKERKYDRLTGVQSFEVGWISKASASQRAGRAGRTGPGHCYRLYSSAVYERDFEEHAEPEILRMPVEGVVLQLKSMDLQHVVNFPFPTPPDRQSLAKAEKLLSYLGAISPEGKITDIGRELSNYPLSPRFSKMLTIGHQHDCMPYTIALVAALATPNIFIPENQLDLSAPPKPEFYTTSDRLADESRTKLKSAYSHAHHLFSQHSSTSDALKLLTALCAYAHAASKPTFCEQMFLSPKALAEATLLQSQLASLIHNNNPSLLPNLYQLDLPSPSKTQISALQQFTAAAFIDQIAIHHSLHPTPPSLPRTPKRAIDVPYLPLFPINNQSQTSSSTTDVTDIAVFIHPSSLLAHLAIKDLPPYIIYSHLQRAAPSTIATENSPTTPKPPKTRMHPLTSVSLKQILGLAKGTPLLRYGKPIGKIVELDGGDGKGRRRECWIGVELVGEKGRGGWPLPAVRVVQRRERGSEWAVESVVL